MKLIPIAVILALTVEGTQASLAATMSFGASRDNTIFDESENSNGQGGDFGAGVVNRDRIRRGLLHFDLNALPTTAQIIDVTLRLHLVEVSGGDTVARDILVHRLNANWGEASSGPGSGGGGGGTGGPATTGDATWNHTFFDTAFWTTPGGDFAPVASAMTSVETALAYYEWTGPGLIAEVQAWIDGAEPNFGWLIRSNESAQGGRRFDSLQSSTADFRPLLTVEFTQVPEPATATLVVAAIAAVAASFGRCRKFRIR